MGTPVPEGYVEAVIKLKQTRDARKVLEALEDRLAFDTDTHQPIEPLLLQFDQLRHILRHRGDDLADRPGRNQSDDSQRDEQRERGQRHRDGLGNAVTAQHILQRCRAAEHRLDKLQIRRNIAGRHTICGAQFNS